jgi:uncharacterized membrane protein YgdD (TMEM256/DUF423 family)
MKAFVLSGSLSAFLAVALGAFGAHALKSRVSPDMLAVWQTGVQYHLFHALGLILVGLLLHMFPQVGGIRLSGWLLLGGTLLFSGSLYLLALTGIRTLGAITPLGGVAFLLGWLLLALSSYWAL